MPDVFLSYARRASSEAARRLYDELERRTVSAFLDSAVIEDGVQFPSAVLTALLGSRVVVIFAEPVYFTRWYCLIEWRLARTPFLAVCELQGSTEQQRSAALGGIIIAFPQNQSAVLDRLPPDLQATQWPNSDATLAIADLVVRTLATSESTLGERIEACMGAGGTTRVVARLAELSRLPQPISFRNVPFAPATLPTSIGDRFVGRADDLWRIDDLLTTRSAGTPGAAALTGAIQAVGGVGKTRLAAEYVHRFGPRRFPGGVFWISARASAMGLEANHYEILSSLHSAEGTADNLPSLKDYREGVTHRKLTEDLTAAFVRLPLNRPALVVVDDLPEPSLGHPPAELETWCPMQGHTALLLTSRFRRVAEAGVMEPLPLDVLSAEASVLLLTHEIPDPDVLTEGDWHAVAAWVGYLPLALSLLNAAFASGALPPGAVLDKAQARASTTHELDGAMDALRSSVPAGTLRGITEAFLAAYNCLPTESQRAARILAQGAPTPLPEELLFHLGDEIASPQVRATMVTRSIVTAISGAGQFYGAMHSVLADFLRVQADLLGSALEEQRLLAKAIMAVWAAKPPNVALNWPVLAACVPHALAVADRCSASLPESIPVRMMVAEWSGQAGKYIEARDMFERLAAQLSQIMDPDERLTLQVRANAARWTASAGEPLRAVQLLQGLLADMQRVLGPYDVDTLVTRGNIAVRVGELDAERGKKLAERLLPEIERALGRDRPPVLAARSNLAALRGRTGDPEGARQEYEVLLAQRQRTLDPSDPVLLSTREHLAHFTAEAGQVHRSVAMYTTLSRDARHALGPNHPLTVVIESNLAHLMADSEERNSPSST